MDTSTEQLACYPFKLVTPSSHSSPLNRPSSTSPAVIHPKIHASPALSSSLMTTRETPPIPLHLTQSQAEVPSSINPNSRFFDIMQSLLKGDELAPDQVDSNVLVPNGHKPVLYLTPLPAHTPPLIPQTTNTLHKPVSPSPESSKVQESEVQRLLQEAVTLSRMTNQKLPQPMSTSSPPMPERRVSIDEGNTRTGSLEISADTQIALESSSSTPPSTGTQQHLEVKEEEEEGVDEIEERFLKTSSGSWCRKETEMDVEWPSLHSNPDKNLPDSVKFPSTSPDDYEDRFGLAQLEVFTDSIQPDTDGLYFCHRCDYTGKKRQDFQFHLRSHYEFQCPKCDYTSRTEGRLKRHMEGFHSEIPPENFSGKCTKQSKPKFQRCKQCDYIAETKSDYWFHQRLHIKEERRLECTQCPFVTEYRHHLEYHIRNHLGSKPYKCSKCNYECVNKSMLNSHMKSHTNVYQYRCANCNYATKYCHSLKMHLSKNNHSQAVVLNVDGSLPTEGIEKSADLMMLSKPPSQRGTTMISPFPSSVNEMLTFSEPGCGLAPFPFLSFLPDPKHLLPQVFPNYFPNQPPLRPMENLPPLPTTPSGLAAMAAVMLSMQLRQLSSLDHSFKIDNTNSNTPMDTDKVLDLSSRKPKLTDKEGETKDELSTYKNFQQTQSTRYECPFCEIIFKNQAFFDIHMRYHNPNDPFLCNRCGQQCQNQIDFFRHLSEKEHVKN